MNAQQLKNSILQEAIEGRLVPQDPNDEPASVLLDKIRREKARLVKEGKLKKKDLEVKPILEDEIPFDIPESWEWVRLKSISACITDGDHQPPPQSTSGVPFLVISNVISGELDFTQTRFVPNEYFDKLSDERKAKKNDVLFTVTGSYGKAILVSTDRNFCFQRHIALVRPLCYSLYILNTLNSPYIKGVCDDKATGMAQKTVGLDTLRSLIIPLPPLAEQKRIVAKIEELLPKVDEYGKAQESLDKLNEELPERLKKSILQHAIEGRLVPQDPNDEPASVLLDKIRREKARLVKEGKLNKKDLEEKPISEDEIPFEIPESWEWCRIGTIFNHSSGKQLSGSNTEGILREYITTSNLYWGRFELENLKSMYYKDSEIEKCTAKQGDLLVCEGGDIGRSAIWPYDYDICLQNHVHRLRPYNYRYTLFVFYIMWFYKSIGLIGGKGIGIKGLSASALKTIVIPLPPLAEQKRIVEKLEQLLHEIDKLKTK